MKRTILIMGALFLLVVFVATSCSSAESSSNSVPETAVAIKEPTTVPPPMISDEELPPSDYLPEIPRISVKNVIAKLDSGSNIVIVDSRSKTSYDRSHITGAISIPSADMGEPYGDLGSYDEIITYCS